MAQTDCRPNVRPETSTTARREPHVQGVLVVDLSDLDRYADSSPIRMRVSVIEQAPAGAQVLLVAGQVDPISYLVAGLSIGHVTITVECSDPVRLRRWIAMLREVIL